MRNLNNIISLFSPNRWFSHQALSTFDEGSVTVKVSCSECTLSSEQIDICEFAIVRSVISILTQIEG